ncbi:hypothetical protein LguiB_005403 [Lonicera macranthoides]
MEFLTRSCGLMSLEMELLGFKKGCRAVVQNSYEAFEFSIKETFEKFVKSHVTQASPCPQLLNRDTELVMSFPYCGSNAVFLVPLDKICIMLSTDSGAHNAIATARAGKELVSSLVSGNLRALVSSHDHLCAQDEILGLIWLSPNLHTIYHSKLFDS